MQKVIGGILILSATAGAPSERFSAYTETEAPVLSSGAAVNCIRSIKSFKIGNAASSSSSGSDDPTSSVSSISSFLITISSLFSFLFSSFSFTVSSLPQAVNIKTAVTKTNKSAHKKLYLKTFRLILIFTPSHKNI